MTLGFGNTLASIGIVIGLGVAIGKILEVSGAADRLARTFVKAMGRGREHWAMAGTGALVSIPVFCDSGYVIMNPLARSIARRINGRYVTLALALGCGMTLTHHLVPPTPGPLGVAGILGADLGGLILAGLVFTLILLPVVVLYAAWMGPKLESEITEEMRAEVYGTVPASRAGHGGTSTTPSSRRCPRRPRTRDAGPALADDAVHHLGEPPAGREAALGLLRHRDAAAAGPAAADRAQHGRHRDRPQQPGRARPEADYTPSRYAEILAFIGHPVVALTIGIVLAVYVLLPRWTPRKDVHHWMAQAAASAGLIILITGAGGALGQVLRDSGVGDALAEAIADLSLPGVLVPFLVASPGAGRPGVRHGRDDHRCLGERPAGRRSRPLRAGRRAGLLRRLDGVQLLQRLLLLGRHPVHRAGGRGRVARLVGHHHGRVARLPAARADRRRGALTWPTSSSSRTT